LATPSRAANCSRFINSVIRPPQLSDLSRSMRDQCGNSLAISATIRNALECRMLSHYTATHLSPERKEHGS
jgi:hypothetical protein